ncbi:pyruvate:ferredoxin (flavodoxin) oxidoreductase [Chitinophaga sancti]|uniref:Pyruvate-ferredoxin/flavodoxin oxidoreductase n=1 Tax=Chitinophaga sancti TaxID=1004 RepID=A0A1K1R755_9BACT|nr:pyruvate:ferredoxin (flavodoxin) oxidoreductase [Chitinophaga sancti]WQD64158.1 pyruvate:ferredoxin (flavodoxin) oxidoreductase [Chitinophaga sancti]WQG90218.1 pyruvate:ferredoxin (flavodoxin) oxidoreductase [Chitinophaga sancti]SFW67853.1 pyruvate-ferredoxin/flavodoxin oxidoreductase [Chitinophaga sancti]
MSQEITPVIATLDGNEAVAYIAYRVNEVCAIYPITPSSTMSELADEWAAAGLKNIWGQVPDVIEMQSEGGAAGVVHGSLQAGALTTTFTASQGLMLMLPNMYKIAGELTCAVFHVAARSLAAQALSIFGDHSDVMAARTTGFAMLASASVQEAHDLALISQAATLKARIPFMHFFDGFRTSHEINKIKLIPDAQIKSMISDELVNEHRFRSLNPDRPFIRGTAQNPDVYFQGRETVNPFYAAAPGIVEDAMNQFAALTGRQYKLFEYYGHEKAERVAVVMGSGGEVLKETVRVLLEAGEKVGVVLVRLFRPFSAEHLLNALPATVEKIVVLDRTKEPGASGEPLYQDVVTYLCQAYSEGRLEKLPRIIGGRYGLSSKEFTPAMAKAVLDELKKATPKHGFTIGINDDVTHTSLSFDPSFHLEPKDRVCALFYGLGADGTVGANKNSIKIIGEETDLYAQGYFVYDSRKSGTMTVSHLRFGKDPILAPWLVDKADFIACHKYNFISKTDMLQSARPGATFLLNSPYPAGEVWDHLPRAVQEQLIEKQMKLYVIDASKVAIAAGMGQRINTIMQTCFFALSNVLPADEAIEQIKKFIYKSYKSKGEAIVQKNYRAVDDTLEHLLRVELPAKATSTLPMDAGIPAEAPAFVQDVTAMLLEGKGDLIPVSKMPIDGTYPSGTTKWEKRNIADVVPVWESDSCIQCGNCSFVCPHSVIRSKFYHESYLEKAPEGFPSAPINARGFPETRYTLQVYLEDCTGCKLCVQACPAVDIKDASRKAINMAPKPSLVEGREQIRFFESMPVNNRAELDFSTVRGAQFLEPLFEFSGACSGCGETPYVKLLTQLFGDRLLVANATGCSSIYGGNLPTTPWSVNKDNRGPAWSNSLFEDNAEFGLGMRVAADKQFSIAHALLVSLQAELNDDGLVEGLLHAPQQLESQILEQRNRVAVLKDKLQALRGNTLAAQLMAVADHLVKRSVWLLGGDGWAYDIGSSGLDHVLSTGRNVNILVLDTEVYSNTGGQMSKATPTAAIAKFAAAGKKVGKKDLAMQAISYGNVYVAQIAMGANPQQTLLAMREAEAYKGPSLILAYSHCIAHGIDMEKGLTQQQLAVSSGYWPLIRYNPALREAGKNPFVLDSPRPAVKFADYAYNETRYKALAAANPTEAKRLMGLAQELVDLRYKSYENMATWKAEEFTPVA